MSSFKVIQHFFTLQVTEHKFMKRPLPGSFHTWNSFSLCKVGAAKAFLTHRSTAYSMIYIGQQCLADKSVHPFVLIYHVSHICLHNFKVLNFSNELFPALCTSWPQSINSISIKSTETLQNVAGVFRVDLIHMKTEHVRECGTVYGLYFTPLKMDSFNFFNNFSSMASF